MFLVDAKHHGRVQGSHARRAPAGAVGIQGLIAEEVALLQGGDADLPAYAAARAADVYLDHAFENHIHAGPDFGFPDDGLFGGVFLDPVVGRLDDLRQGLFGKGTEDGDLAQHLGRYLGLRHRLAPRIAYLPVSRLISCP